MKKIIHEITYLLIIFVMVCIAHFFIPESAHLIFGYFIGMISFFFMRDEQKKESKEDS